MDQYFPKITDSFLKGQDVLYGQFNDISVYVEDEKHENFYYQVLRKLFPSIKIEKIFPLNGKNNVVNEAKQTINVKDKIYIVDRDFDHILHNIENLPNLFYLDAYCIENYLIEEAAIHEVIIEEKPKTERSSLKTIFPLDNWIKEAIFLFPPITTIYFIIQKHKLGLINTKNNAERFFAFNPIAIPKGLEIKKYIYSVELLLKKKDKRLSMKAQLTKYNKYFKNIKDMPGKYLVQFLKSRLRHLFSIQMDFDSFSYRLAKNCRFDSLSYLKAPILNFIS
ncbi:MAG: DUF4435 domain-containing protein [Syntrophales bacterium]|jgi:hypothetical protein|nr:DUF4435 domain-containing protein [Syntrophales bacterium]